MENIELRIIEISKFKKALRKFLSKHKDGYVAIYSDHMLVSLLDKRKKHRGLILTSRGKVKIPIDKWKSDVF